MKVSAKSYWQKHHELAKEAARQGYRYSMRIASAYVLTGDKYRAFEWLCKAYTERDQYLFYGLKVNAEFNDLRPDPRYASLIQRVGLPQCIQRRGCDG